MTGHWLITVSRYEAEVCVLLSSCEERDSSCSDCRSGPVSCSQEILPTTALLMSGGDDRNNSVEVFLPTSGHHCRLVSMPGPYRVAHTMDQTTVCGGLSQDCISLDTGLGVWTVSSHLLQTRYDHCSWSSPSGVMLLGSSYSATTTEILLEDGRTEYGFPLLHNTELGPASCQTDPD